MTQPSPPRATRIDHAGLNLANFFLAELTGVILPFLSDYLKQQHWNYDRIGLTVAMVGSGMFLFQIPAGILSDKIGKRRILLSAAAVTAGLCYALLPAMVNNTVIVDVLLLIAGAVTAFFVPLLAALALSLVGHDNFDKTFGINQSFDHMGNIAISIASLVCVSFFGINSIFYIVGVLAILTSLSLLLISSKHLNPDLSGEHHAVHGRSHARPIHHHSKGLMAALREQFQTPAVLILIISATLFNIANAPGMATIGLYLKSLGSNDNAVAWAIIISQMSMIPVAYLAAKFCATHGRKPVMAFAFAMLAVRFVLYPLTNHTSIILAIQILNGFDAGIYSVVIALICGDLTEGKEGFNTILGTTQLAIALGGIIGPVTQGMITQHLGFPVAFFSLSFIAMAGGIFFVSAMPETHKNHREESNKDIQQSDLRTNLGGVS